MKPHDPIRARPRTRAPAIASAIGALLAALLFSTAAVATYEDGVRAFDAGRWAQARAAWTGLAAQGHAGSQYGLARLYWQGLEVERDEVQAWVWAALAHEQGWPDAEALEATVWAALHGEARAEALRRFDAWQAANPDPPLWSGSACPVSPGGRAYEPGPPDSLVVRALHDGRLPAGADALRRYLREHPTDDRARFALAIVTFLRGVERLGQGLYRHGLEQPAIPLVAELPFLRVPVPHNPEPERLTYGGARSILVRFTEDMASTRAALAAVATPPAPIALRLGCIRLDLDGDGRGDDAEALWRIFDRLQPDARLTEDWVGGLVIAFDAGDVAWLRGYAHLLSALAELALALDWEAVFDHALHPFFPRAGLPSAVLLESPPERSSGLGLVDFADAVAFVHLARFPVVAPERLARVREHLLAMVAASRESWRAILAETDDVHEWVPGPAQTGALNERGVRMRVTEARVDGWHATLDELEALLEGRRLVPHWRIEGRGINLRRVFAEARVLDPVLWVQGSAALPFLEAGELTTVETWEAIMDVFGGDFFAYAVWFN